METGTLTWLKQRRKKLNFPLSHERTTGLGPTVWQAWDGVQNECQHVGDSLCLISSANKVHFRENRVVHFA